jgi:transcriptional regulator of heat shock response
MINNLTDDLEKKIFYSIIEEYIKRGKPVGSKLLNKTKLHNIPPSTIRFYMQRLSNKKLIENVEDNSGRIPTDYGWYYFIKNQFYNELNNKKMKSVLDKFKKNLKKLNPELPEFSRKINLITEEFKIYLLFIKKHKNKNYYFEYGLKSLFKNYEFIKYKNLIYEALELIDYIKNYDYKIVKYLKPKKINILIGSYKCLKNFKNFSILCSYDKINYTFLVSVKRINYPLIYKIFELIVNR